MDGYLQEHGEEEEREDWGCWASLHSTPQSRNQRRNIADHTPCPVGTNRFRDEMLNWESRRRSSSNARVLDWIYVKTCRNWAGFTSD